MATTLQVFDTGYNADSVEWCPLDGLHDILVCGTYQLEETNEDPEQQKQDQTRVGKLHIFQLDEKCETSPLIHQHGTEMPGILDIKWCSWPLNHKAEFGLVNSVGELRLYQLSDNLHGDGIKEGFVSSLGENVLGLSLDWSNKVNKSSSPIITCSASNGNISLHQITPSALEDISSWKAHDFEAWITAFNYWDDNIVYSGGDDCKFKGWDRRQDPKHPLFTSKRHSMGVCSVQSCPSKQHLLCTGSYDENVLVWDDRNMKKPLSETNIGGGVWRVKWKPHTADCILTATMYNGFHILDASDLTRESLPVLCHYTQHNSIAYGADWCLQSLHTNDVTKQTLQTIATCSFYDHCLHLWNYTEKVS